MASVIHRTTLEFKDSVFVLDYPSADWIHNPDLSLVSGVPQKYWKTLGDSVVEMTPTEKDAADLTLPYLDVYGYKDKDYKVVRYNIMVQVVLKGGFDNLTAQEKEIAARWFAVAQEDRDKVFTTEQQVIFGKDFHVKSTESRKSRVLAASMELYNRLPKVDVDQIMGELVDNNLYLKYVDFGSEGIEEGDITGIYDYVLSRVGTPYETTGFASKPLTPVGMTLSELVDKIMAILRDGDY